MNFPEAIEQAIELNSSNPLVIGELCQLEYRVNNGLNCENNIKYLQNCIRLPGILYLVNEYFC